MSVTAMTGNDVIPIEIPTVGGSTDVWGTELNDNSLKQLSQAVFGAREDRNLSILGGGKISWNQSGNQVSFTEDIVIRDHVTDKTVTITTAASPITLDAAQKVAYVEINRGPSSNQSISAATVVAAGSLPNTKDKNGVVVLFHRTTDGTILVPWTRREILDGDHWQWGAALSWFERLAAKNKPSFQSNPSDTSQLILPASAAAPAAVFINGKLYGRTSNATLDLDTAGRNGLDTGAKAANTVYYLYAIPATSGRSFDIICSLVAPTGAGPSSFTSTWSYIGSFATLTSSALDTSFTFTDGVYRMANSNSSLEVSSSNTAITAKTFIGSAIAKRLIFRAAFSVINAAGDTLGVGGDSAAVQNHLRTGTATASNSPIQFSEVPVLTANTVYTQVTSASDTALMRVMGWVENPMEYQ